MDEGQPLESKLEFARHALGDVQELIRFMDQKGGFIVAIAIFFVSSFFSILQVYAGRANGVEAYLIFALALWYLGHTAASIWNAIMTTKSRHPRLLNSVPGPGLGFPLAILATYHSSSTEYIEGLKRAKPHDLLADIAEQVVTASVVYADKAHHLDLSVRHLLWSAIPWFAVVVVAVVSLGLPEFGARGYILLSLGILLVVVGVVVRLGYRSPSLRRGQ